MMSERLDNRAAVFPESPDDRALRAGLCAAYLQALRELAVVHSDEVSQTVRFVASHALADEKGRAAGKPVVVDVPLGSLVAFPAVPAGNGNTPVKKRKRVVNEKGYAGKTGLSRWRTVPRFAGCDLQPDLM
ncbi:hypothetical protein [Oxalobacter paraformigenes]|uniref:Uncharacterized protein n=2 Tax=Oxalobacter paraformigenes TaxID=556268 RepID=C3X460_9BURK|nr:hypothetical protein [Oxalobacter paraformigenes]EEO27996.1 hypothetical protein OFAG_01149 [Oxalobacter paraformigenes]